MLPCPSISPDLSPIDSQWQKKMKVRINSRVPENLQELKRVAIEAQNIIPLETMSNIIKNYKERLLKVNQMKDYAINY